MKKKGTKTRQVTPNKRACEIRNYFYKRLQELLKSIDNVPSSEKADQIQKFAWSIHKKFWIEAKESDQVIFQYIWISHQWKAIETFLKINGHDEIVKKIQAKFQ